MSNITTDEIINFDLINRKQFLEEFSSIRSLLLYVLTAYAEKVILTGYGPIDISNVNIYLNNGDKLTKMVYFGHHLLFIGMSEQRYNEEFVIMTDLIKIFKYLNDKVIISA